MPQVVQEEEEKEITTSWNTGKPRRDIAGVFFLEKARRIHRRGGFIVHPIDEALYLYGGRIHAAHRWKAKKGGSHICDPYEGYSSPLSIGNDTGMTEISQGDDIPVGTTPRGCPSSGQARGPVPTKESGLIASLPPLLHTGPHICGPSLEGEKRRVAYMRPLRGIFIPHID